MHATDLTVPRQGDMLISSLSREDRAYLNFLAGRHGRTRDNYEQDLKQYATWCAQVGIGVLDVERVHVELYLEWLRQRGLAESTVARRFGTTRLFLKQAYEDELIPRDPTLRIKPPKVDHAKQYRTWFTTVDMVLVLREAEKDPRDLALLTFMADTALRVGELCALNVEDLTLSSARAFVRFVGKGAKFAEVELPFQAFHTLSTYLAGRTTGPLFLNRHNRRMTRRNVADVIDRLRLAAGIPYRVTSHGIRRTHARTLAEHGEDLLGIAESLRHADPRVTRVSDIMDAGSRGARARARAADLFASMAS
jgi:integrase/recombinase XerC